MSYTVTITLKVATDKGIDEAKRQAIIYAGHGLGEYTITTDDIEQAREHWAKIAKANGWYAEPFYVQVWMNEDGTIEDSVSFKGMTGDIILGNK